MTTIEMHIERGTDNDWRELTVEVRGTVSRYRPATRHSPAEGGEVEIDSVTCNGVDFELTREELDRAEGMLAMQAADDEAEARYARADWERDSRIDGY